MSKLSRREFKELLTKWTHSLTKNELDLINEVSIKEFRRIHPDFDTSNFNSQLRGNTDYLDIISNSIKANQNHDPMDYIQQFEFYKNSIEPNRRDNNFLTINIPGQNNPVSLVGKVNPGSYTATFDDIQKFQQARMFVLGKGSKNKLASAYEKVLKESSSNDFELIINDSEWIIFYPKTIRGSIALGRSYWNGKELEYDRTFNPSKSYGQNVGKMNWCTTVSGEGNMFLNYHKRKNVHMYYCIKKNMNVQDPDRKLCISFDKKNNVVSFWAPTRWGSLSVDGNNNSKSEEDFRSYIGKRFDVLFKDAEKPERLEIDEKSYYESISLNQYKTLRNVNEENIDDLIEEFESILKYSKDKEKIFYFASKDKNYKIRAQVAKSCKSDMTDLLRDLASEENIYVKSNCAANQNTPAEYLKKIYDYVMNTNSINKENKIKIIENLANNKNTPSECLTKILKYIINPNSIRSINVKNIDTAISSLVENQNTPSKDLSIICDYLKRKKMEYKVELNFLNLIKNKNTPEEVINDLCFHSEHRIRKAAIKSCKDENTLIKLSKHLNDISSVNEIIRNKFFNKKIQKTILNKFDLKEISQELLNTKTIDRITISHIFNSIRKNLDEKDNFVTLSLIATNSKTDVFLRKKILKKYNFAKAVFNDYDTNLNFEEFFDKYKNINIDFSELETLLKNKNYTKLNEYLYSRSNILNIIKCKAAIENPREMYLFLKERGIDISNEIFIEYVFEDPMAMDYSTLEQVIADTEGYHPWVKKLFNVSENVNESNNIKSIKEYIRLLIS